MKNSRRRNTRLKYLIVLLLLTAIIFGSSTYAWFTTNRMVKVTGIDVNIQAVSGIQISVDASNWRSFITAQQLREASYTGCRNQIPAELLPVSSAIQLDSNGRIGMFIGTVEPDATTGAYELKATQVVEQINNNADGRFVAFDIYLKTSSNIENVYISEDSGAFIAGGGGNSQGIQNATRIVLIKEGNIENGGNVATIRSAKTTEQDDVIVWEPNADSHTDGGILNAKEIYGIEDLEDSGEEPIEYDGIRLAIEDGIELADCKVTTGDTSDPFGHVRYNDTETPANSVDLITYPQDAGDITQLPKFSLAAGITKFKVYMWIEGQDVDCENNASGTNVNFVLEFTLDDPNAPLVGG